MRRFFKALGWVIALGALAALIGHRAWSRYQAKLRQRTARQAREGPQASLRVSVRKVAARDVRRTASLTGTVRPMAEVRVMSKVSGRLEELRLDDGTPVDQGLVIAKKGLRVAIIDHGAYEAQVQQAQAALTALRAEQQKIAAGARPEELEIARANVRGAQAAVLAARAAVAQAEAAATNATREVERVRKLFGDKVVTRQQLDNAEAQYAIALEKQRGAGEKAKSAQEQLQSAQQQLALTEQGARQEDRAAIAAKVRQAEAALRLAQINLDESTIRAPIAGVVAKRNLDEGNMVSPAVCIVTLVQMDTVKVVVGVSERDIAWVNAGRTQATVRVDAYPGKVFRGTVREVSPVADELTRTVAAEIHIPNREHRLKPGMFARVELVLQEKTGVPVVPEHAVLRVEGATHVFVVEAAKARRRTVRLGLRDGPLVEVVEGVQAGEWVVTRGHHMLEDGRRVVAAGAEDGAP